MNNYQSNSHKSREEARDNLPEKKKVEKVVTGSVKTKKKNEFHKLAEVFLPEDINAVKNYILVDILVPSIKKFAEEAVKTFLWGGGAAGRSSSGSSNVSYRNYYNNDRGPSGGSSSRGSAVCSCSDIIFGSRRDADAVLSQMDELVETYGHVSVADVYDLAGMSCDYTCHDYGWYNIRNAAVVPTRNGSFIIDMPKAIPLRK